MSGISVEIMPDAGAPQVGITVDGLDPAIVSTISVFRSTDGRTWLPVRGLAGEKVTGAGFWRDHVPPLNVTVVYRLLILAGGSIDGGGAFDPEVYDPVVYDTGSGGSLTTEASILVPSESAWLQDPLNPRSAVSVSWHHDDSGSVRLLSRTAAVIGRRQPVDLVTPEGSRLPVASIGTRQGPSGVLLHLRAFIASQGALVKDLRDLFDEAGTVVIRGLPQHLPIDPVAHVVAPDLDESAVVGGVLGLFNDWNFTVTQVRPPGPRIVVPWWTYDQVKALWAGFSYEDVLAARPGDTYLDWLRTPEVP